MKFSRDERTAYHEAGHVVSAIFLRYARKPKIVTIIPDQETGMLGYVLGEKYSKNFHPDIDLTLRREKQIEHDVIVYLSGFYAEQKFTGRRNYIGSSTDYSNAVDFAHIIIDDSNPKTFISYFNFLEIRAKHLIEIRWEYIERLAKELLIKKTMKRNEIYNFVLPHLAEFRKEFAKTKKENRKAAPMKIQNLNSRYMKILKKLFRKNHFESG